MLLLHFFVTLKYIQLAETFVQSGTNLHTNYCCVLCFCLIVFLPLNV